MEQRRSLRLGWKVYLHLRSNSCGPFWCDTTEALNYWLELFWRCLGDYWPQTAKFRSIKIRNSPLTKPCSQQTAGIVHQYLAANRMFFGQTDHLVQKFQSQRSTCARPQEFTSQFPSPRVKLCWFLTNIELLGEREEPVFHLFIASWEQHLCLNH